MFLALRDLRIARGRFALVGVVIGLVALLSTVLTGLASGLVDDGVSGLRALPLTHLAFQPGAHSSFSRSTLTEANLAPFEAAAGVETTPLGVSFVNATSDRGTSIDVALFGVAPRGFLLEASGADPQEAATLLDTPGLVLSRELAGEVEIGEHFVVIGSEVPLPVIGFTFGGSYGHVPIAFTSLDTWRSVVYGGDAGGRFSAIALAVTGEVDLDALDEAAGTETRTKTEAYGGSPGFSAEQATMSLIRGFLLVISALVVGAFFTVWTIQRTRQIGLLKALGATNGYVLRDALGQLALVLAGATAAGSLAGAGVGTLAGGDVPFNLRASAVVGAAGLLTGVGMAGSAVALRRITAVDPALALGVEA